MYGQPTIPIFFGYDNSRHRGRRSDCPLSRIPESDLVLYRVQPDPGYPIHSTDTYIQLGGKCQSAAAAATGAVQDDGGDDCDGNMARLFGSDWMSDGLTGQITLELGVQFQAACSGTSRPGRSGPDLGDLSYFSRSDTGSGRAGRSRPVRLRRHWADREGRNRVTD